MRKDIRGRCLGFGIRFIRRILRFGRRNRNAGHPAAGVVGELGSLVTAGNCGERAVVVVLERILNGQTLRRTLDLV